MLSEVPEGWLKTKQDDVATFYNGRAYKLKEWESAGTPVIRLQNLTGSGKEFYYSNIQLPEHQYCDNGDLLFMWSASFGAYIWNGGRAIYHYHIWKIEQDAEKLLKQYHYFFLQYYTDVWKQGAHGMAMLHLTKNGMEQLEITIPPLNEQKRIAEILSSVDASIQATKAAIAQAERVKRGLMEELLTGGLGSEAIERGEVPEGWRRTAIGNLCKVVTGKTPSTKKEEYWDGDIPFFTPADLSAAATVSYAERTVTREALMAGAKLLPKNSILYTCIGSTIGKVAVTNVECCTNQQINACVVSEEVDYNFLYFQLVMAKSVVKSLSSTTAVPIINKTAFSGIEVVLPAVQEQRKIADKLAGFDVFIGKEKVIIEQLNRTKSGLMDDLLTGKVRTV